MPGGAREPGQQQQEEQVDQRERVGAEQASCRGDAWLAWLHAREGQPRAPCVTPQPHPPQHCPPECCPPNLCSSSPQGGPPPCMYKSRCSTYDTPPVMKMCSMPPVTRGTSTVTLCPQTALDTSCHSVHALCHSVLLIVCSSMLRFEDRSL